MGTYSKLLKQSHKLGVMPAIEPAKASVAVPKLTQKSTHISKGLSKSLSKSLKHVPSVEEIEELAFRLRKIQKVRINGDVPPDWKKRLDDLAHELGIGRYDLVMYIIGRFLNEVEPPKTD